MKTIAFAIQKGGAGKTTLAYHTAHALALAGRRVLAVDLDPQASMSKGFIAAEDVKVHVRDYFESDSPAAPQQVRPFLSILCADRRLATIERSTSADVFFALKERLQKLSAGFDYCVIDTPPSLGILPTCGLIAADGVIIPVEAEPQALDGLIEIRETIGNVKRRTNPQLTLLGHVLSNVNWSRALSRQSHATLKTALGASLFDATVATSVRVAEAWSYHKSVFEYDPDGKGSRELKQVATELMRRLNDVHDTAAAPTGPGHADPAEHAA